MIIAPLFFLPTWPFIYKELLPNEQFQRARRKLPHLGCHRPEVFQVDVFPGTRNESGADILGTPRAGKTASLNPAGWVLGIGGTQLPRRNDDIRG